MTEAATNFNAGAYWQGVRQRFDEIVKPRLNAETVYGNIEGIEKKTQGEWIAKCPLPGHEDSSPSFRVNPHSLKFHCFGCGCGGDAVRFTQLSKQISVKEAFSELANKAGIHPDAILSQRTQANIGLRDQIIRQTEATKQVAEIRQKGLEQETKLEAEHWSAIHAELNGLPHRIRMLEHATDRFAAMHNIRLKELDRVQGIGRMVSNLITDQHEKELINGTAVRNVQVKLPGNMEAAFVYTSHYENRNLKTIHEDISISRRNSTNGEKEIISEQKWQFAPESGWTQLPKNSPNISEQKPQNIIEVPTNPIDAVRLYATKCMETKTSLETMDKQITKHLATEIAKLEELLLKLPAAELSKVEEAIRKQTEQPPKIQNAVIKFPGGREVHIQHEAKLDKSGRVIGISETINDKDNPTNTKTLNIKQEPTSDKDRLYIFAKEVATAFQENLKSNSDTTNKAKAYLEQRGINKESLEQWKIGIAENSVIANNIKDRAWSLESLHKIGVMSKTANGEYRCSLAGRIIFPIEDEHGRICGFAGRVIGEPKDSKEPKYINTCETEIFSKKDLLYGLKHAKDEIIRENEAIVVEGYFDAIALHQHGIKNTVATMGTALNEKHATKLAGLAPDLVIAYDPDAAGFKAAGRAAEIAAKEMRVRRVELPDGMDPDEAVRKVGANILQNQSKNQHIVHKIQNNQNFNIEISE